MPDAQSNPVGTPLQSKFRQMFNRLSNKVTQKQIAILGTSNSIMRAGWLTFFSSIVPKTWEVKNLSLGGNCALFMPGQIDAYNISSEFDLCIIELPVNDQRYVDSGYFRLEYFAATLAGILAKLMQPGSRCIPIVLSLPKRSNMAAPSYFGSCEIVLNQICAAYGVEVFDVGASIRAASFSTARTTDDFFSDQLHLCPSVQRHIASALVRRLKAGVERQVITDHPVHALAPVFQTGLPKDILPEDKLVRRETSLAGLDVVRLQPGETLHVPGKGYFCGLLHWADQTTGHVDIAARSSQKPAIRKLLRKEWRGGIFFFTHLHKPMPCDAGIEITSESTVRLSIEPSINAAKVPATATPVNEIAYLVFCDRDPDLSGQDILKAVRSSSVAGMESFDPVLTNQLRVIPLE
jgi:hypothetical protein